MGWIGALGWEAKREFWDGVMDACMVLGIVALDAAVYRIVADGRVR